MQGRRSAVLLSPRLFICSHPLLLLLLLAAWQRIDPHMTDTMQLCHAV
jgi:hypothetical protein